MANQKPKINLSYIEETEEENGADFGQITIESDNLKMMRNLYEQFKVITEALAS